MKPTLSRVRHIAVAGTLLAFPAAACAMTLDPPSQSWLAGAVHPLVEYTHLVALLALGIAAALLGGKSPWGLPVMAVSLLAFGVVLGMEGATAPMANTVMLTTALCLVLLILGQVRLPLAVVGSVAGAFALFHGVADGMLMDVAGADASYAILYGAVNVLLLIAGVGIGEWIHHSHATWVEYLRHWRDHTHGLRFGS